MCLQVTYWDAYDGQAIRIIDGSDSHEVSMALHCRLTTVLSMYTWAATPICIEDSMQGISAMCWPGCSTK
jgi:hypothetical protein